MNRKTKQSTQTFIGISLKVEASMHEKLKKLAISENRTLKNYIETKLKQLLVNENPP